MTINKQMKLKKLTEKGLFKIEGWSRRFSGYSNTKENWNGWACPKFDLETALEVLQEATDIAAVNTQELQDGKTVIYFYDRDDRETYLVEGEVFETVSGPIELFDVGNCQWCWEAVNVDVDLDEEEPAQDLKELPVCALLEQSQETKGTWKVLLQKNGADSDWWCVFEHEDKYLCEGLANELNQALTKFNL